MAASTGAVHFPRCFRFLFFFLPLSFSIPNKCIVHVRKEWLTSRKDRYVIVYHEQEVNMYTSLLLCESVWLCCIMGAILKMNRRRGGRTAHFNACPHPYNTHTA